MRETGHSCPGPGRGHHGMSRSDKWPTAAMARGRQRILQPSLRDEIVGCVSVPGLETLGYRRPSLRDRGFNLGGHSDGRGHSTADGRGHSRGGRSGTLQGRTTGDTPRAGAGEREVSGSCVSPRGRPPDRSCRSAVRLQISAQLAIANDLLLLEIDAWRIVALALRWQMVPARMSASMVVPIGPNFQDVVEVPLAHHVPSGTHHPRWLPSPQTCLGE